MSAREMNRLFILKSSDHVKGLIAFVESNWQAFAKLERPLAVDISEYKAKRSSLQNARLHALLSEIAEKAWVDGRQYPLETWKEFCRKKFIGSEEIDMPDGTRVERGISTTTLGVSEFSDFMQQIESYAATELGVEFYV